MSFQFDYIEEKILFDQVEDVVEFELVEEPALVFDLQEVVLKIDGDAAYYEHIQNSASIEWIVDHNLGKYPSVTVIDSSGRVVHGRVTHVSKLRAVLNFSSSFSGKAVFN